MSIKKIIFYPKSILEKKSTSVKKVNEEVISVIQDLVDTLYSTTGVGLSASQIGINKRIFIYDHNRVEANTDKNYKVLINPKITFTGEIKQNNGEGCKSLPGFFIHVPRYEEITVEGLNEKGEKICINAKGFEAQVLQHELEHIDGKMIFQNQEIGSERASLYNWYLSNLEDILEKIQFLKDLQDGIIFEKSFQTNKILVVKKESQIQLFFSKDPDGKSLTGIMSRIDILNPLNLLGIYTQAMTLALLWTENPTRIYILGFGGGRLGMFFYHYFPKVIIESTEIDSDVVEISQKYFGIHFDNRMKVSTEDGKLFLQQSKEKFDIIFLDAYDNSGTIPHHLSNSEFYFICKKSLSDTGVVSINLNVNDSKLEEKILLFTKYFKSTYKYLDDDSCVLFGTDSDAITTEELRKKASTLDEKYCFLFPYVENAKKTKIIQLS